MEFYFNIWLDKFYAWSKTCVKINNTESFRVYIYRLYRAYFERVYICEGIS